MEILDSRLHGNDKIEGLDSRLHENDNMEIADSCFLHFREDLNDKIEMLDSRLHGNDKKFFSKNFLNLLTKFKIMFYY